MKVLGVQAKFSITILGVVCFTDQIPTEIKAEIRL